MDRHKMNRFDNCRLPFTETKWFREAPAGSWLKQGLNMFELFPKRSLNIFHGDRLMVRDKIEYPSVKELNHLPVRVSLFSPISRMRAAASRGRARIAGARWSRANMRSRSLGGLSVEVMKWFLIGSAPSKEDATLEVSWRSSKIWQ